MKQFFALLITLTFSALVLAQAPADLVLVNGKIWTMDDKRPEVEAVAVLGNRIAAVGSTEEIRKCISLTAGWGWPACNCATRGRQKSSATASEISRRRRPKADGY